MVLVVKVTIVSFLMILSPGLQQSASITSLVAVHMVPNAGKLDLCIIVCNNTVIFVVYYV